VDSFAQRFRAGHRCRRGKTVSADRIRPMRYLMPSSFFSTLTFSPATLLYVPSSLCSVDYIKSLRSRLETSEAGFPCTGRRATTSRRMSVVLPFRTTTHLRRGPKSTLYFDCARSTQLPCMPPQDLGPCYWWTASFKQRKSGKAPACYNACGSMPLPAPFNHSLTALSYVP
jgi:hypothetical protein